MRSPQTPRRPTNVPPIQGVEPSAEQTLHQVVERMEDRLLHHCDRPEIEMKILAFLAHALGPTTDGIAREMDIGPDAALTHLTALHETKRIWGQVEPTGGNSWPITHEGRHYLAERTQK